jgi:hypothetical protein
LSPMVEIERKLRERDMVTPQRFGAGPKGKMPYGRQASRTHEGMIEAFEASIQDRPKAFDDRRLFPDRGPFRKKSMLSVTPLVGLPKTPRE